MNEIKILDAAGRVMNAKVEVGDGTVIVHSRSGAGANARNPDYRPAVEAILARLFANGVRPDVYLDSRPVQHLPLSQRRIARGAELLGTVGQQFDHLIRAMNAGSSSHGAWRRILLEVPGIQSVHLGEMLTGVGKPAAANTKTRLPSEQQRRVRSDHIDEAVSRLIAGWKMPQFDESRDYDLVSSGGEQLAPKRVFGLALELAGVVPQAFPHHFSAGWGQPCFELLEAAGYRILTKPEATVEAKRRQKRRRTTEQEADQLATSVGLDREEQAWIEGDKRIVGHMRVERKRSSKAAAAKRAAIRSGNGGKLRCERCDTNWYEVYPEAIAEAVFEIHHTTPLAQLDEAKPTTIEDLLCLCANCHRAEHRRMALGASV